LQKSLQLKRLRGPAIIGHSRAMSFTSACRTTNAAARGRGRALEVANNNRNNASLPQAGD
jgi:hypothetical protein